MHVDADGSASNFAEQSLWRNELNEYPHPMHLGADLIFFHFEVSILNQNDLQKFSKVKKMNELTSPTS